MIGRIGWFLVATLADLAMTSGFPLARVSAWHSFPGGGGRRIPLDQRSVPVEHTVTRWLSALFGGINRLSVREVGRG